MRPIFGKLILVFAVGLIGCSENLGGQGGSGSAAFSTPIGPTAAFAVLPSTATVPINQTQQFFASGGTAPYTYSVSSCPGSIDAQTGLFQAGATGGTCTVMATDSTGATSIDNATVTVTGTVSPPATAATWTDTSTSCYLTAYLPACSATAPSSLTVCQTADPSFTPGGSCAGSEGSYCISAGSTATPAGEGQAYEIYSCQ